MVKTDLHGNMFLQWNIEPAYPAGDSSPSVQRIAPRSIFTSAALNASLSNNLFSNVDFHGVTENHRTVLESSSALVWTG